MIQRIEKINKLLKLNDVQPRDCETAKANYERLSEAELDAELEEIAGHQHWLREWRKRTAWARTTEPDHTLERLKTVRARARSQAITQMVMNEPHPILATAPKPVLTYLGTIEALGRIQNAVINEAPDLIIAANDEGAAVSTIVCSDLGYKKPIIRARGWYYTNMTLDYAGQSIGAVERICVIGHIAVTGRTLSKAIGLAHAQYPGSRIFAAALAASVPAAYCLAERRLYYHYLAWTDEIEVRVHPKNVKQTAAGFEILPDESPPGSRPPRITAEMLANARFETAGLDTNYGQDPIPATAAE